MVFRASGRLNYCAIGYISANLQDCKFGYRIPEFTKWKPDTGIIHSVTDIIMRPTIGMRLKELRLAKQLYQEQVAQIIGVNKSTVSSYENDMRQPPYDTLVKLARLYHVSTDYLLGVTDARSLDVRGLTEAEIDVISELVSIIAKKNDMLKKK